MPYGQVKTLCKLERQVKLRKCYSVGPVLLNQDFPCIGQRAMAWCSSRVQVARQGLTTEYAPGFWRGAKEYGLVPRPERNVKVGNDGMNIVIAKRREGERDLDMFRDWTNLACPCAHGLFSLRLYISL